MKNLKIRFIKQDNKYILQCKKWYGWKYARIQTSGGLYEDSSSEDKSRSLNKYLHFMGECKQYIRVTEYPTIKKY